MITAKRNYQKLEDSYGTDSHSEPPGTNPANTLTSDLLPSQLRDNNILLFEATNFLTICCSSPGKLLQHCFYFFLLL